ncbi:MAG: efflux RND transporter periplasmic adaptor subunit [Thermodesulfobacteriota bacterium]
MNGAVTKNRLESFVMNISKFGLVCLVLATTTSLTLAEEDIAEEGHEEEGGALILSVEERSAAGIVVDTVMQRALNETLRVPAEVVINAYQSARVTPRMQAQVVARHVQLGSHVETGQSLVTLSSVALAEAQGDLIVADREWQRVKSLGQQAVGERRYTEAQVARQQALAKVLAFGMQESQANDLLKSGNAAKAVGEFDLLSPLAGTVLQDNFITGELIEPGRVLFDISDESILWVEARMSPSTLSVVEVGAQARVSANGTDWIDGTVIQLHHRLNETTRTQGVRIAVENSEDLLHPGQFAEAEIITGTGVPKLVVPSKSLTLIEGKQTVFKLEAAGEFHPANVRTGPTIGDWVVILSGIEEGESIAISGVFHLKSLLLKSSLGEGHAH